MRIVDAVVKTSAGRTTIQPLVSPDFVRVNERALVEITRALSCPDTASPGWPLVERLAAKGLLAEGEPTPWERRDTSDLVSLEIEPVGACNLKCGHCFVEFTQRRMSPEVFEAALGGAQALGAVEMSFNGGEPLLHPRTLEYIERARSARLRVQLFTNATRVTPAVADRLADAGLAKVAVSLDGFAVSHDRLRGRHAFARAVAGLRLLTDRNVPVQVTVAVHAGNATEVDALVGTCREEWGVRWVRLSTIAPLGRAAARPDLSPDAALFAQYRDPTACVSSPVDGALPCLAGVDKLFVSAGGDVHGCHLFDAAPPLGRLSERTLEDIYRAPDGPTGRVLHHFEPITLDDCFCCPALDACRGGCRARAFRASGHLSAADPVACRTHGHVLAEPG